MGGKQMSIGDRIRDRRQVMQVTQHHLASSLGLTPQHISAIEQGKRTPSLLSLAKLAEELGVSTDYLVSGKEGIITDTIPAIKADKRLNIRVKKALVTLIEELQR